MDPCFGDVEPSSRAILLKGSAHDDFVGDALLQGHPMQLAHRRKCSFQCKKKLPAAYEVARVESPSAHPQGHLEHVVAAAGHAYMQAVQVRCHHDLARQPRAPCVGWNLASRFILIAIVCMWHLDVDPTTAR